MRVLLDTNVLISGVLWHGPAERILDLWLEGRVTLVVTLPILEEYREVLLRFMDQGADLYAKWDHLLTESSELIEPVSTKMSVRDPDDRMWLEAAAGGKPAFIVSGDKDLLVLKEVQGIPVIQPHEFLSRFHKLP